MTLPGSLSFQSDAFVCLEGRHAHCAQEVRLPEFESWSELAGLGVSSVKWGWRGGVLSGLSCRGRSVGGESRRVFLASPAVISQAGPAEVAFLRSLKLRRNSSAYGGPCGRSGTAPHLSLHQEEAGGRSFQKKKCPNNADSDPRG